jgi:hypothetical protein
LKPDTQVGAAWRSGPLWNDAAAIQAEIHRLTSELNLLVSQPGDGNYAAIWGRRKRLDHLKVRLAYVPIQEKRRMEERLRAAINTPRIGRPTQRLQNNPKLLLKKG